MCKQAVSPDAATVRRAAIRVLGAAALLGTLNVNPAYSQLQNDAKEAGLSPAALSVSVTASPAVVDGKCPAHIRFAATIVAEAAGVITYRWERSDGALATLETATLGPGKNIIDGDWLVGGDAQSAFTGWQSLRILNPVDVVSNKASFEVRCDSPPPPLLFKVNPSLKPGVPELPQLDVQARRVARLVGPSGAQTDFVEDELVVMIEPGEVFDRFLRRSHGIVLWSLETDGLAGMPPLHLVRVDTRAADVTRMEADFRSLGALGGGNIEVSSQNGMRLLAVAAAEIGRRGIPLSINFLAQPTDFLTRRTAESGVGVPGWNNNAFTWPYMSRRATNPSSVQDIGVGDAWRALQLAGVLGNRVSVAVLDSGFQRMPDMNFELMENPLRDLSPRAINPFMCSDGNPCPWHGTNVVSALAGLADNGGRGRLRRPCGPRPRHRARRTGFLLRHRQCLDQQRPGIVRRAARGEHEFQRVGRRGPVAAGDPRRRSAVRGRACGGNARGGERRQCGHRCRRAGCGRRRRLHDPGANLPA